MSNNPRTEKQIREEAKIAYDGFVQQKGDFFQKKMVPMSIEDIARVQKDNQFTRRISVPVFLVFAAAAFIGSFWLMYNADWIFAIGIGLCAVALTFFSIYLLNTYRDVLQQKEKVVITGIVTDKKKYKGQYQSSYYLTLNERQEIVIAEKEFKQFHLGDIVQYDSLSLEQYISHSIVLIGKISDRSEST